MKQAVLPCDELVDDLVCAGLIQKETQAIVIIITFLYFVSRVINFS